MSGKKERPIIFSAESVRAILDGRKTQTRRVIEPQPYKDCGKIFGPEMYVASFMDRSGVIHPRTHEVFGVYSEDGEWGQRCPYGKPGDRLWVRETWRVETQFAEGQGRTYYLLWQADGKYKKLFFDGHIKPVFPPPNAPQPWHDSYSDGNWKSSRFMPRWASRILLEITDVRVERLHEISEADTLAEGVDISWKVYPDKTRTTRTPITAFIPLWDSIHAKRGYPWESNPYIWAIEFRICEEGLNE